MSFWPNAKYAESCAIGIRRAVSLAGLNIFALFFAGEHFSRTVMVISLKLKKIAIKFNRVNFYFTTRYGRCADKLTSSQYASVWQTGSLLSLVGWLFEGALSVVLKSLRPIIHEATAYKSCLLYFYPECKTISKYFSCPPLFFIKMECCSHQPRSIHLE